MRGPDVQYCCKRTLRIMKSRNVKTFPDSCPWGYPPGGWRFEGGRNTRVLCNNEDMVIRTKMMVGKVVTKPVNYDLTYL